MSRSKARNLIKLQFSLDLDKIWSWLCLGVYHSTCGADILCFSQFPRQLYLDISWNGGISSNVIVSQIASHIGSDTVLMSIYIPTDGYAPLFTISVVAIALCIYGMEFDKISYLVEPWHKLVLIILGCTLSNRWRCCAVLSMVFVIAYILAKNYVDSIFLFLFSRRRCYAVFLLYTIFVIAKSVVSMEFHKI